MDSLFRKKNRPRQSSISNGDNLGDKSIPYDKIQSSGRAPSTVGPSRGGLQISAPITNPNLTADGTDLNVNQLHKKRAEREREYANYNANNGSSSDRC